MCVCVCFFVFFLGNPNASKGSLERFGFLEMELEAPPRKAETPAVQKPRRLHPDLARCSRCSSLGLGQRHGVPTNQNADGGWCSKIAKPQNGLQPGNGNKIKPAVHLLVVLLFFTRTRMFPQNGALSFPSNQLEKGYPDTKHKLMGGTLS